MHPATKVRAAALLALAALVTVLPFAVHRALTTPGKPRVDMSRWVRTEPSQWWWEQRSFPTGTIPAGVYDDAFRQAKLDREQAQLSTSAGLLTWQFVGPDNIGGRVTALAVGPGGTPIYMGAANGGVFKSTDTGATWTPIFDEFSAYSIGALALDPTNPSILYVGTGEANPAIDTYDGNGVYRSSDGGVTWEHLGLENVKRINRIVVDSTNTQRILVAGAGSIFTANTDHGIWRSEDGGQTWNHVLYVNTVTYGADIAMNPVHPESLYCSMWDFGSSPTSQSAIYRSTDHGTSWTRLGVADGLPASNDSTDRISLAYSPSRPTTIYAHVGGGAALSYNTRGFYRSTDGGATWQQRDTGASAASYHNGYGGFSWYFGTIGADPIAPDKVYALGVSFLRSTDGGASWSSLTNNAHVDNHAIWINRANTTRIYIGNDGGFWRTTVGGVGLNAWTKGGVQPISQFYAITVDPTNASRQMGGTQDNNSLLSGGTPSSWNPVLGGDGFYPVIDHTTPTVVFAEYQNMSSGTGPQRSTSGGSPGTFVSPSGFSGADRYNWDAPYVMDPTDHMTLLAGSNRIYKSIDNGVTYTPISGELAQNPSSSRQFGTISTISISPLSHLIYFTGSSNGKVYRSTDGGGTWSDKTLGLPIRYVTRVTTDPFDSMTVYCSLSGFNGSHEIPVHLYKSTDLGGTWNNISGNLPNVPVNDILVDNLDPQRLYAGTDLGVYTTQNGGTTWYPLGQGLPWQAVFDLYLHTASRTLFAGTHGRSMYKLDLSQVPTAVGDQPGAGTIALSAPSPNPSRGPVSLTLTLPRDGRAQLAVFDPQGRRVRSLNDGTLAAGRHDFTWDGRDAAGRTVGAGVYFVRADVPGGMRFQRVIRTP